jgi:protein involved in polysaccharide export with SLBB domain
MNNNTVNDKMYTFKNFIAILLAVLFGAGAIFGQLKDRNDRQDQSSSSQQQSQNIMSQLPAGKIIQDGPVDPKEYIVGPGDIFNVSIWSTTPLTLQIPVTPEGTVIIPTVSEINISGMTLDSAKKIVLSIMRNKYLTAQLSFTLAIPRTLVVTVKGAIKEEGKRYVQATQRVDEVVNFRKEERGPIDSTIAQRNIIVQRRDGSVVIADIEKYYATGEKKYNPLLGDGDIIIIPQKNLSTNFIAVFGAVNRPGLYESSGYDSLCSMLLIARGLTSIADSSRIVISRYRNQSTPEIIAVDLRKIIRGEQFDIQIKRSDRIFVYDIYLPERANRVTVSGEVKYPGVYPISKDSTFLSEIIGRAGGITSDASLKGSQLFRRSVNYSDIARERLESGRGGITVEDSAYYYLETDIRLNRELVVADFSEIIQKNNKKLDVVLRDGDEVHIAMKKNTIYVFGQVVNPGHVSYVPNKNVDYYITRAGGMTDDARSDIKVIKASTRQWLAPEKTEIEEGDYIWVPKEPYRPFSYYLTVYSQVFGIIATVVSLMLLVTQN